MASIVRTADAQHSALVVIGVARNELLGELMLGRTVDGLLRRCRVPLLVVKARARRRYRHIVVATDFSAPSRHALYAAMRFFPEEALLLFHACDLPTPSLTSDASGYRREYAKLVEQDCENFLQEAQQQAAAQGVSWRRPQVLIEYGAPNLLLRDYISANPADLVVVGTHGRGAVFDVFIGSTAKRILDGVPCDVLMVREPRANVRE